MDPIVIHDDGSLWFEYTAGGLETEPIYRFRGTTMDNLVRQSDGIKDSSFSQPYGDDEYWIASAWTDPATGTWYATVHVEFHYTTSGSHFRRIGLATSTDDGAHWHYDGDIITSDSSYNMADYSGAYYNDGQGDQKLFVDTADGYFYLYYRDDVVNKTDYEDRTSTMAVARCSIADKMAPGCWRKFYNGSWSQPGLGGHESAIFSDADSATVFFDTYIGRYIAIGVYETALGDFISEATNLASQNWSAPQPFSGGATSRTKWYNWPVDPKTWARMSVGQIFRLYSSDVDTSGPTKYMDVLLCKSNCNMLQNGSFDSSRISPWQVVLHTGGEGFASVDSTTSADGPDSANVAVTQANQIPWYVQFSQGDIPLSASQKYTVSFWAKASKNRPINVVMRQGESPFTEYTNHTLELTQDWLPYSFTVTPGVTDGGSALQFNVAQATGHVWLDNVSVQPDVIPTVNAPAMTWVKIPGYRSAVVGSGWSPGAEVGVSLSQRGLIAGLEIRTSAKGTFEVGIRKAQCKFGWIAHAQNFAGVEATARGLHSCGSAVGSTAPALIVNQGHRVQPKVTRIVGLDNGRSGTIVQGNAVYLWEKGENHPSLKPTAPSAHFFMIGHGQTCRFVSCDRGFFWEWIATTIGHTDITVAPWCAKLTCRQHGVAIPITIVPAQVSNQATFEPAYVSGQKRESITGRSG